MRKLLFILLMIASFSGFSQKSDSDIVEYWNKYLSDCNTLIADTISQTGVVNCDYKPVISNGKTVHFIPVPVDTVWNKVECREYKTENEFLFRGNLYSGGGIGSGLYNTSGYTTTLTNFPDRLITYSEPEVKQKITISIVRNKICWIKKQEASWEDFWNRWMKEKGIIKFN
jgi:hypothetical protein